MPVVHGPPVSADWGGARVVLHVDMDAFYAACELRDRPDLKGKPVIVGADPRGGRGRGVVLTATYEARRSAVRSGMPISQAYRLCPEATFLPPHFDVYERVSHEVFATVAEFGDATEQTGIDEAFLDATSRVRMFDSVEALALAVKGAVRERHGISCSIGVAPNKAVAKIASDFQKPDGLTLVPPDLVRDFLAPLAADRIVGVGKKTREALEEMGLATIEQLAESREALAARFGSMGDYLWKVANGVDESPVKAWSGPPESISNESTFGEDVEGRAVVWREVEQLAHWVQERAAAQGLEFRTVGLKWRFADFTTLTRMRTLRSHAQELAAIVGVLRDLVGEFDRDPRRVRLVGVRVSDLRDARGRQATLEAWGE